MPVYSYECSQCGGWDAYVPLLSSEAPECPKCGGREVEKVFSISKHIAASAFPYVTRNLTSDGSPVEVKSASHLEQLCKKYGKTHRPDAAWMTKEYLGWDPIKKKQVYREASGVGLPGCWIALMLCILPITSGGFIN